MALGDEDGVEADPLGELGLGEEVVPRRRDLAGRRRGLLVHAEVRVDHVGEAHRRPPPRSGRWDLDRRPKAAICQPNGCQVGWRRVMHVEFIDQTLRDGQQSLWGLRMRAYQAGPALPDLDATGFRVIDLTGA